MPFWNARTFTSRDAEKQKKMQQQKQQPSGRRRTTGYVRGVMPKPNLERTSPKDLKPE